MRIHLVAIGRRMPDWMRDGFDEYTKRLPRECSLELKAIDSPVKSASMASEKRKAREAEALLAAVPTKARIVALDERGSIWSTNQLAAKLDDWQGSGRDIALLSGGLTVLMNAAGAQRLTFGACQNSLFPTRWFAYWLPNKFIGPMR